MDRGRASMARDVAAMARAKIPRTVITSSETRKRASHAREDASYARQRAAEARERLWKRDNVE